MYNIYEIEDLIYIGFLALWQFNLHIIYK